MYRQQLTDQGVRRMASRKSKGKSNIKERVDATLVELTERVVASIEADPGNWTQPWRNSLAGGLPVNIVSKRRYSGGNLFWLSLVSHSQGWSNVWGTYKQWASIGCQVRKGEHGTLGMFYKPLQVEDRKADGTETTRTIPLLRGFYLFNAAQVDNSEEVVAKRFPEPEHAELTPIEHAEAFFAAIGADVRHGGDRAFFRPSDDFIQLPPRDSFSGPERYYATMAHEHVHWTGHESRLDRTKGKHFGDDVYAREELVAELGAVFVQAHLDINVDPTTCGHDAYLASWLRTLKSEPRALWSVLGDAARALDFLTDAAGELASNDELEEVAA